MSAVGLLLLEDPKARARAEARIRNGGGKRRSFFGRSGTAPGKAPKPSLPPTIPDEEEGEQPAIIRPSTSLSIPGPGRKKPDSSDRSSSRNSIFGRKNSVGELSIKSGTSSSSQISGAVSMNSYTTPPTDPERYDKLKHPISNPSQYQQANQTAKTNLRALETVQEKDVPAKGWRAVTRNRTRAQNNGVAREEPPSDLESDAGSIDSRPMSPISLNPPLLPPAARISRFDETMFSGVTETSVDGEDQAERVQSIKQSLRDSKRHSALMVQREQLERTEPVPQVPGSFVGANSLVEEEPIPEYYQDAPEPSLDSFDPALSEAGDKSDRSPSIEQRDFTYRAKDALPPVPEQQPTQKASDSSLGSASDSSNANSNPEIRVEGLLSPNTAKGVRNSSSTGKSPSLSFSGDVRESTVFSDSTWEDDVDFIYEQGAEAACDFDWDFTQDHRISSVQSDGGVRLSHSSIHTHAASVASDVSRRDSRTLSGAGATIAERRQAQKAAEYTRGSSVGHRGFAAARNSTEDFPARKGMSPTSLTFPRSPTKEDGLSPIVSVAHTAENGAPRSPATPSMLQFPLPPASERYSDNLSDPESWRNSASKHRKSSSYGSVENSARTSTATTTSGKDMNRWSVASGSSVPPLVHSKPKRTSSLSKSMISAPLEALPQQPEDEWAFEVDSNVYVRQATTTAAAAVAAAALPGSEEDAFVMRRPRTSGERRLLQAAGRQRYRPATPSGGGASCASGVRQSGEGIGGTRLQSSTTTGPDWL